MKAVRSKRVGKMDHERFEMQAVDICAGGLQQSKLQRIYVLFLWLVYEWVLPPWTSLWAFQLSGGPGMLNLYNGSFGLESNPLNKSKADSRNWLKVLKQHPREAPATPFSGCARSCVLSARRTLTARKKDKKHSCPLCREELLRAPSIITVLHVPRVVSVSITPNMEYYDIS